MTNEHSERIRYTALLSLALAVYLSIIQVSESLIEIQFDTEEIRDSEFDRLRCKIIDFMGDDK